MKKPSWRDVADAVVTRAAAVKDATAQRAAAVADREKAMTVIASASASARRALEVSAGAVSNGAASLASGAKAVGAGIGTAATKAKEFAKEHPQLIEGGLDLALDLIPGGKPASKVARFALSAVRGKVERESRESSAPSDDAPSTRGPHSSK